MHDHYRDLHSTMRACLTRPVLDFDMAGVLTGRHVLPRLSRRRDSASAVGIAPSLQPLGMASSGMVHCRRAAKQIEPTVSRIQTLDEQRRRVWGQLRGVAQAATARR